MTEPWLPASLQVLYFHVTMTSSSNMPVFCKENILLSSPVYFTSSHWTHSSCSQSFLGVFFPLLSPGNPGFPVFLCRPTVTICLDNNQSNKRHMIWIYFSETLHQSGLKRWDGAGAKDGSTLPDFFFRVLSKPESTKTINEVWSNLRVETIIRLFWLYISFLIYSLNWNRSFVSFALLYRPLNTEVDVSSNNRDETII